MEGAIRGLRRTPRIVPCAVCQNLSVTLLDLTVPPPFSAIGSTIPDSHFAETRVSVLPALSGLVGS